jgi:hypothetical protein
MPANAPEIGKTYVCRNTAPPGWAGERVVVRGVSGADQRTARVEEADRQHPPKYETIVSWDDLVHDAPI